MGGTIWLERLLGLTLPPPPATTRWSRPLLILSLIGGGLLIAWLPPLATALLVGAGLFGLFLLRYPLLAIYLLILVIPFSSFLAVAPAGFKIGLMEMLLAAGLAAWLLRHAVHQRYTGETLCLARSPAYLTLPLLLFLGSVSLSWLNALSIGASLIETIKWVEVLLLYLLLVNALKLENIRWLVLVILLAGLIQAGLGLYQFIFKVGPEGFLLFDGRFLRAYGAFAQPNPYAGYLGLILPLALSLFLWALFALNFPKKFEFQQNNVSFQHVEGEATRIEAAAANHRLSELPRPYRRLILLFLALLLGALLAALFASQSRSGLLAFAGAAAATLVAGSRRPGLLLAAGITGAALVGLAGGVEWRLDGVGAGDTPLGAVTQRLVDAAAIAAISDISTLEVTDANFSTIERLAHWQAAREMWRDQPWLGVGFGNYAAVYPAYAVGRWLDPLGHAHNYLLNLGAETGLVGITAYLIFWIAVFGVLWAAIRRSSGVQRAIAAGCFGSLVHLHIHNLFDNLYVQGMYLHIAVILAIISTIRYAADARQS